MIVPAVGESEWMRVLAGLPKYLPAIGRTLIISPHPDDETLGCGGLIADLCRQGVEVVIAAVTDGERAYPNEPGLALVRRREQDEALAILGVRSSQIHRFQLPDSDVSSHAEALIRLLRPLATATTRIVAPWRGDYHPDHESCGRAAESVATETGATLVSYFFWTWHRGTVADLEHLQLLAFPLTAELLSIKTAALRRHRSQLTHASGAPILPDNLLGPAKRSIEVFAQA